MTICASSGSYESNTYYEATTTPSVTVYYEAIRGEPLMLFAGEGNTEHIVCVCNAQVFCKSLFNNVVALQTAADSQFLSQLPECLNAKVGCSLKSFTQGLTNDISSSLCGW
jgi:hypothetical protein